MKYQEGRSTLKKTLIAYSDCMKENPVNWLISYEWRNIPEEI